jgi:hypothetical protein
MADVSNIITLGIGPESDLMHFLTSGLGSEEIVLTPVAGMVAFTGLKAKNPQYKSKDANYRNRNVHYGGSR